MEGASRAAADGHRLWLRRPAGAVPAGTAGALLPHDRLLRRGGGPGPGDVPEGVAEPGGLRRPGERAHVALPHRLQHLPGPPAPASAGPAHVRAAPRHGARRGRAAGAHRMAAAVPRRAARGPSGRGSGPRGPGAVAGDGRAGLPRRAATPAAAAAGGADPAGRGRPSGRGDRRAARAVHRLRQQRPATRPSGAARTPAGRPPYGMGTHDGADPAGARGRRALPGRDRAPRRRRHG